VLTAMWHRRSSSMTKTACHKTQPDLPLLGAVSRSQPLDASARSNVPSFGMRLGDCCMMWIIYTSKENPHYIVGWVKPGETHHTAMFIFGICRFAAPSLCSGLRLTRMTASEGVRNDKTYYGEHKIPRFFGVFDRNLIIPCGQQHYGAPRSDCPWPRFPPSTVPPLAVL
jgi:hypothetical protein